jgi:Uma2 family endonuclease
MTIPAHRIHYTLEDYFALEAASNVKHEFLDGQIYAMAGGTPDHAALAASVIGLLFQQLRKTRCRVYDADLRVRVPASGLVTYPDVTVVCGPRERDTKDPNAIVNPTLIVEVLSPSTEEYDRGDKFEHYKTIASLRQYVVVSHSERCVDVWARGDDGSWTCQTAREPQTAEFSSIGARLEVKELYDTAQEPPA